MLTDERTARWEVVILLGHPATIEAARRWHLRVWQIERFARGQHTDTSNWNSVRADINTDRARFCAAARRNLGISTGDGDGPGDRGVAVVRADRLL
jgi:hypothetical protein